MAGKGSDRKLHKWAPPRGPVKWEHCCVCGIIRNAQNTLAVACKGPAPAKLRAEATRCVYTIERRYKGRR